MSYNQKGYMQGERSFKETIAKCCQHPANERKEVALLCLQAASRFKRVYNRKQVSEEGEE